MTIRPWRPDDDDLEALTLMLHESYRELLEQGLHFTATSQPVDQTRRRLSQGEAWMLEDPDGRIVGTVSLSSWRSCHDRDPSFYRQPGVWHFSQLAVADRLKGLGWGRRLIEHCELRVIQEQGTHLALDTSDQAERLISLYQHLGYAIVDRHVWGGSINYGSVIMAKSLLPA